MAQRQVDIHMQEDVLVSFTEHKDPIDQRPQCVKHLENLEANPRDLEDPIPNAQATKEYSKYVS
jgi:hypothetical protein